MEIKKIVSYIESIALEGRGPSTYGMINITKKDWFRFRWVDE